MYSKNKKSKIDYLFLEPVLKMKSWNLARFRFSQIMHDRTNGYYSLCLFNIFKYLYPKVVLPVSSLLSNEQIKKSVIDLKEKGFKVLDFSLTKEEINSILDFAYTQPTYGQNESEATFFDPKNPPTKQARYVWKIADLVQNNVVKKLMKDSSLHAIAQDYLESKPVLSHITLWLDPVSENQDYQPHVYHQDNDGPKYLKFFFYITDVDVNNCPHSFIQGTHRFHKNKKFAVTRRYTDKELLDFYGNENEIVFTAPAGTVIAEDTMGFHKGSTPKIGYRLLMQIEYTIQDVPYINELENEDDFIKSKIDGLDKNIKQIIGKLFE